MIAAVGRARGWNGNAEAEIVDEEGDDDDE